VPQVSALILLGSGQCPEPDSISPPIIGQPMLERVLAIVAPLSDDLLLVGSPSERVSPSLGRFVPVSASSLWPLESIRSGLREIRHERGLVVGSNMPLLNPHLLRYMVLLSTDYDAVIPRVSGRLELFPAVYGKSVAECLDEALTSGTARLADVFSGARVRYLDRDEVEALDPQRHSFLRVDSPEKEALARRLLRGRQR
jgi:molybdopterin-guanine dinucleotide biosynthesis protein A